jgi:hypothetical protein
VNYIKHLSSVHEKIIADDRLSPWHVSLYYALFHNWNFNQFSDSFQIVRRLLMVESKIGSVNTYTRCLKELNQWGYIKYFPSYNPHKSSVVTIITFDTSSDNGSDKGIDKGTNTSADNSRETSYKTYINNKNIINSNSIELDNTQNENDENFVFKKEKNVSKKVETNTPKNLEEVEAYFSEKDKPKSQANKFFNFYEANGWLVGKNKMKNWRAAANNWMANIGKYDNKPQKEKTTYLHVDQDKDYSVPL